MDFEGFKKLILELKTDLSQYKIREVFGCAFVEMTRIDWKNPTKMNLHSPFRQCGYIASLALSAKQIDEALPLDKDAWKAICAKANKIYDYYDLMYFPKDGDFSKITKEKHDQGGIAMPSFLLNFCAGVHASVEQVKEDVASLYTPFSKEIEAALGIGVHEIIEICTFIENKLQSRIEGGAMKAMECWQQFRKELDSGIDPGIVESNARKCMDENVARNFLNMGIIKFEEIQAAFSKESATAFMDLLSQERASTSNSDDIIFPTETLSISQKPLAHLNDGDFALITGNHLILAIQENLYGCLENIGLLEKFNKHKGEFLENKALQLFQGIFENNAQYYPAVCETPGDQNEHDLLIVYERTLLIVECKANRIRKGFRDIEKSFPRIKDDFKSYIQEGYNQARNLKKLVLSQQETTLYKMGGDVAVSLKKDQFDQIEKIVLTYENEGLLATKLSLLLTLDSGDSFPLCLNIQDLRQLSVYKQYIGLTAELFFKYLKQRKLIHEKIANDDELDIFGFFLKKRSLNEIIKAKCELFYIEPGFSAIFDEAYNKEKFPEPPAKKIKIGRNDPCHCGSGKKHKKCHGSRA
ncbi:MAG: SEC-C metal-binding domain-containing protein [Alphaproteobacteria bacterium]